MKSQSLQRGVFLVTASLLLSSTALAQQFGGAGTFAVSAERLFGFSYASQSTTQEVAGTEIERSASFTSFSLLGKVSTVSASWATNTLYSFPRLAGDYFVIQGLSLGAGLGIVTGSSSLEQKSGNISREDDGPSFMGFLIAPRVGYAFPFTASVGLWPRGGITYVHGGVDVDGNETNINATALTLEVPLVIAPVPHVAIGIGPSFDIGLGGSVSDEDDNKIDFKGTEIGVQASLTAYF